jgi:hypothetical protein
MRLAFGREELLALVLVVVGLASGCAQGGGFSRTDAGTPGRDAGTPGVDSGPRQPDAGPMRVDAGPRPDSGLLLRDSGPPPRPDSGPPGCTSSAECDDGVRCNGAERCELNRCVAGTPLTCDDGIACTRDRCVEPTTAGGSASCEYIGDDALCPAGQSCNRTSGCSTTCSESPCRLTAPQCGCSSGLGCFLSGTVRTCAMPGSGVEGASCTTFNSCQAGLLCLNVSRSTTAVNQCGRFCATDADCRGAGSVCAYTLDDGTGGSIPGVRVCSRSCNPLTSTGCVAGASCQIFEETGTGRYFTDCTAPVGAGGQNAPCTTNEQCQRGFACVGTPGTCLRYCNEPNTIGGGGCSLTQACYGFTTPLRVGTTEYGVCDAFP